MPDDRKRLLLEVVALLVVVALIVAFMTRHEREDGVWSESRIAMGTVVTVTVFGDEEQPAQEAINAAFAEIDRIEALATTYSPDSEVSRLNEASWRSSAARLAAGFGSAGGARLEAGATDPAEHSAAGTPITVDRALVEIVMCGLEVSEASAGAFDMTIEPLARLWRVDEADFSVPAPLEIACALVSVDYHFVGVDSATSAIALASFARLNLDGVAKGYAVDRALSVLTGPGVESAIVDAGGDLGFIERSPDPSGWKVGIKHPRDEGLLGVLTLDGGSVATSGDYQRFATVDGVRYHHIIDPSNGYPARGVISVTVTAETAARADALATAVFVMGAERGMALVESLENVEALIVTGGEEITGTLLSSGLAGRYEDASTLAGR